MKGIYIWTQLSTGKVYIGQSSNLNQRYIQHITANDDLCFHPEYRKDPTDFSYRILAISDDYTAEDLNSLEKYFIEYYHANDPRYGFNATAGNGNKKAKPNNHKMLNVKGEPDRIINAMALRHTQNKRILVIGNFNVGESSLYNNVTVLSDDYGYTCNAADVKHIDSSEDTLRYLNMSKEKFDLIIANPPYDMASRIITEVIKHTKDAVVLMPFSKYKSNELYKHVVSLQLVDPKCFDDAIITDNLCVCRLIPQKIQRTFEELELETFEPKYRDFYELNSHRDYSYIILPNMPAKYDITANNLSFDINTDFMITTRTVLDGTHSTDAHDMRFNLKYEPTSTLSYMIRLPSEKAKHNICKFWYKNSLQNDLIKGLNKKSGKPYSAIPNLDWTKDRDYEHCTLDDIMTWLREDNNK